MSLFARNSPRLARVSCRAAPASLTSAPRFSTTGRARDGSHKASSTRQGPAPKDTNVHFSFFNQGHSETRRIVVPAEGSSASSPSSGRAGAAAGAPAVEGIAESLKPLRSDVYAAMPPTLRDMSIYGKTVPVTGGARGLGYQMARACAEAGARNITIFDANKELGDAAAKQLSQRSGLPVAFVEVDVRDAHAIQAGVDEAVKAFGAPDVLVNAAGIADSNILVEEYSVEMFRRLIDINLTGTFLVAQAVGKAMMKARKTGSLILVASMSGSVVNYPQEQSCYNASKAGVVQFAKSIAAEWAKHGIRVNCISPGYMDTALNRVPELDVQKDIWRSLTPQKRLGAVSELNGLCVFLASDASSFMTGANVLIDGGYSCY